MKIRTITCHDVYNYGASLQAYALMKYLENSGHDARIIDYKPEYSGRQYNFWRVPRSSRFYTLSLKSRIFHLILCIYFSLGRYRTVGRYFAFKRFKKEYLHLTEHFKSYNQLRNMPPDADVYIAGSDQIWNTALPNGKDPAFFLNFGSRNVKRVAYAASFGLSQISKDDLTTIKHYLSVFDAISVREQTGVAILQDLGYSGINVVDPVFLLNRSEWINFAGVVNNPCKQKYILVYDLLEGRIPELEKYVKECAFLGGYRIISINHLKKLKYADVNIMSAGPLEFLSYLYNADYVVSTSFHATAFSLIFNKPFACFYNLNNSSRIADLLNFLSLDQCFNPSNPVWKFDWSSINRKLDSKSKFSRTFLNDVLV